MSLRNYLISQYFIEALVINLILKQTDFCNYQLSSRNFIQNYYIQTIEIHYEYYLVPRKRNTNYSSFLQYQINYNSNKKIDFYIQK